MRSRNLFASTLMACLLAVGFLGIAPVADGASAGQSVLKSRKSARNYVIENKRRGRGLRFYLPIGPGTAYNEYPYYYSRGFYPTHIRGYVYYPHYYYYHRSYYRGPGSTRRQRARRN